MNLPLATVTNVWGGFALGVYWSSFFSKLGIQMSTLRDRIAASTEARLSVVTGAAANLTAQLSELNELCEQVRKAELSARRSRRTNHRNVRVQHANALTPRADDPAVLPPVI